MQEISFKEVQRELEELNLPDYELVVGIADGGVVLASLIAFKLGCDLRTVRFRYRNQDNTPQYPEPLLLTPINISSNIRNILLVDDVTVSGKTLESAKKLFSECKVTTLVLWGKADYVLFPEITTCVKWPWKV